MKHGSLILGHILLPLCKKRPECNQHFCKKKRRHLERKLDSEKCDNMFLVRFIVEIFISEVKATTISVSDGRIK